uniref:Uncharacterized protein n=1 Tax=Helianthus annuus TaxID=4232 RepID=A0A251T3R7_HELAN
MKVPSAGMSILSTLTAVSGVKKKRGGCKIIGRKRQKITPQKQAWDGRNSSTAVMLLAPLYIFI